MKLPKCPHCGRRPTLEVIGRNPDTDELLYGSLPCCSARYVKEINHATRLQRIRDAQRPKISIIPPKDAAAKAMVMESALAELVEEPEPKSSSADLVQEKQ